MVQSPPRGRGGGIVPSSGGTFVIRESRLCVWCPGTGPQPAFSLPVGGDVVSVVSNHARGEILRAIFRGDVVTFPVNLYLALCTATPTASETGGTIPEVANSNAYARQAINPSHADWTDPTVNPYTTSTAADIVFPTATGSWGTVTSFALVDSGAYGAGNVWWFGDFTTSKAISTNDIFEVLSGNLTIGEDS